ncbi:MAG TPA: sugar nucleotide-binding protein [Bacteroidales bacterium]|nr:sugar nucleotide-binding protein [Bacteroidales bacterium]
MDEEIHTDRIQIWGGAEYSYVRVRDNVYDQLAVNGHEERTCDPDLFATLGIRHVRYPLLWEKYSTDEHAFFEFHDKRLERFLNLGIKPVAGFLHHGSGPFFTSLYENDFPELLAEFAFKIASRYPWILDYTPINEPLTTARFSGLYGIWYPHRSDDRSFVRILVNEIKGIILSVKAVRSINPLLRLIQTEDITRIHSTEVLNYQAAFENNRRWLTYDLLMGKVDSDHPLFRYFIDNGITNRELDFFLQNPVIPDIAGFNYYVTSERYLDHEVSVYPSCFHGTNGIHNYADVEAVRANISGDIGSLELLREAWERYNLPMALTEVHLACTREEQLRWFNEAWENGLKLRKEGIDFRAITAWSFFGSHDWSSLLCEKRNDYESGIYDIRSGKPRPTALAGLIRSLNETGVSNTRLTLTPGWWRRGDRFIFKDENDKLRIGPYPESTPDSQPILITGAGSLGKAFASICSSRGINYVLTSRNELDIASEQSVRLFLEKIKPWAIINAAGFTRIDEAENSQYLCFRENTVGAGILAELSNSFGIKLVTFSTDQVFNGKKKSPYNVKDLTSPLNLYGLSKKLAEEKVLKLNNKALVIRSSYFFNPWNENDSLAKILHSAIVYGTNYYLPSDIIISPSYIPHLVNTVLDLLIDGESGIWHLSGEYEISYYDLAKAALGMANLDEKIVFPVPAVKLSYPAARPSYSVLKSSSGIILPSLESSLENFLFEFNKNPLSKVIEKSPLNIEA